MLVQDLISLEIAVLGWLSVFLLIVGIPLGVPGIVMAA